VSTARRIPKVRIAWPRGRAIQLRYTPVGSRKEVRISTGCRDLDEAEEQKKDLEARLRLGQEVPRKTTKRGPVGPMMGWDDFLDLYRERHLKHLRKRSRDSYESRLKIAGDVIRPSTLADMAKREALVDLRQNRLEGGSAHYARSFMAAVLAALHWAEAEGILPSVPRLPRIKTSKLKAMKGRPITGEEFERILRCVPDVVGEEAAESYRHVLQGLWTSGLRIGELMTVSWDIPGTITPLWRKRREPVLIIPSEMQKNDTEEEIPLLPWFEDLIQETPESQRTGWCFNPVSLESKCGRPPNSSRPQPEWVAKVISRIGKKAQVVVSQRGEGEARKIKYASAHDLRRSCAERLQDAGVPEKVIQRIMRHESWETTRRHYAPGRVQTEARVLRETLESADCT
jgi:integrase